MPTLTVTKEFEWDCAHQLHDELLSKEDNKAIFGDCNNIHGHTYKMYVTVSNANMDLKNGMIINFKLLKSIVDEFIVDRFDHTLLNNDPLYDDKNRVTTCEHMVYDIWNILKPELLKFGCKLEKIKLYETPGSYAELVR